MLILTPTRAAICMGQRKDASKRDGEMASRVLTGEIFLPPVACSVHLSAGNVGSLALSGAPQTPGQSMPLFR